MSKNQTSIAKMPLEPPAASEGLSVQALSEGLSVQTRGEPKDELGKFSPNKNFVKLYSLFMSAPKEHFSGSEVCEATGLRAGAVYPLLHSLEQKCWLSSSWEELPANAKRTRPQKKFYQATTNGIKAGRRVIDTEYPHLRSALQISGITT